MMRGIYIRVPGSIGNVGPGFDTFGLAVQLYLHVWAQPATKAQWTFHGEDADRLAASETHRIATAMDRAAATWNVAPPVLAVRVWNELPVERGLGGSGAAALAGIALVATFCQRARKPRADWLDLAIAMEGHADNVAASFYGGLTVSGCRRNGIWWTRSVRVDRTRPVLLIWPPWSMQTETMRAVLPAHYPRDVVVHQLQTACGLILALDHPRDWPPLDLLDDALQMPYRLQHMPDVARIIQTARVRGMPAVLSGAGPTVAVFPRNRSQAQALIQLLQRDGRYTRWRWRLTRVSPTGIHIERRTRPPRMRAATLCAPQL